MTWGSPGAGAAPATEKGRSRPSLACWPQPRGWPYSPPRCPGPAGRGGGQGGRAATSATGLSGRLHWVTGRVPTNPREAELPLRFTAPRLRAEREMPRAEHLPACARRQGAGAPGQTARLCW